MKTKIRLTLLTFAAIAAVSSCTGNKCDNTRANDNPDQNSPVYAHLKGKWNLEKIVFSDSDYVSPSEELPGVPQYIVFEDSTCFIQTNCNTSFGSYTVKGDSITFGDGGWTEIACENMTTEDALRRVIPNIATVFIANDSIARLDSRNPSEYIVLRKATEKK